MTKTVPVVGRLSRTTRGRIARVAVGGVLLLSLGLSAPLTASASGPSWSNATSIPGVEPGSMGSGLNVGGYAQVAAISCASSGNCSEGGSYYDAFNDFLPFVATETNGSWTSEEVPGIASLDTMDQGAQISSLSCSSSGNCSAGGYYEDANNDIQGFFVDEVSGVWQQAQSPSTLIALNQGGYADVQSVSCSSDGACAAVGIYLDVNDNIQGFVAGEVNGTWTAYDVPSLDTLNAATDQSGNGYAQFTSVSCSSAGNCSAVGSYRDDDINTQGFVANEVNGAWTAYDVPSLDSLNASTDQGGDGYAQFTSVSCWSAGNCGAGGYYVDANDNTQGFVASEVNGTWTAYDVPSLDLLNQGDNASVKSVSCSSDGSCTAVGSYRSIINSSYPYEGFYLTSTGGAWGSSLAIAGLSSLNVYGYAAADAVSCSSSGNCALGGYVQDQPNSLYNGQDAFVASEINGTWSDATLVPGLQTLNTQQDAGVTAVSCASDGSCLAGGYYRVAAQNNGLEFITSLPPAPATSSSGGSLASVTNLVANELPGEITASWNPSSGATSYTCTLLYAIGDPSTFSTTTTSSTCSFTGLSLDDSYGVRVVATSGGSSSTNVDAYASYSSSIVVTTTTVPNGSPAAAGNPTPKPKPKATSIVCVKGKVAKRIRAVDPHCPVGYHKRTT